MSNDKIVVYVTHYRKNLVCEFDGAHNVAFYTKKFLYPTGKTWFHNNGYTESEQPIYTDAQNREWRKHETIDYINSVYYVCETTPAVGTPRPPYNGKEIV